MVVVTRSQSKKIRDKRFIVIYERNEKDVKVKKSKSRLLTTFSVLSFLCMLYFIPELREHFIVHRTFYAFSYCVLVQFVFTWRHLLKFISIYAFIYLLHGYGFISPIVQSFSFICDPLNDIQCCILFTFHVILSIYLIERMIICFTLISIVSAVYFITFSMNLHSDYIIAKSSYSEVY